MWRKVDTPFWQRDPYWLSTDAWGVVYAIHGVAAMALIKSSFVILAPGDAPLRTSARNRLVGTVIRHDTGAVNDEVVLDLGQGKTLTATITRSSGESLDLKVGDRAQALVKASHVILAVD